jgi:hypothetical protein
VTGGWRKLHNEELHNLYSSLNELHNLYSSTSIIRMIKSKWIICAGHVACMRRKGTHVRYLRESQKERDQYEDQDVREKKILECILEKIG